MTIKDDFTPIYTSPMDIDTYRLLKLDQPGPTAVNGHSNKDVEAALNHAGDGAYHPCPEAFPDSALPTGRTIALKDWRSEHYPGTSRRIWIHLPANISAGAQELGLILFNDGQIYVDNAGAARATKVLDSLHASGDIRPTVGVFVMPGRPDDVNPDWKAWSEVEWNATAEQRSIEYDSLRPDYAEFLHSELLPFVETRAEIQLTSDPQRRIICGASSGAISAFTCAWQFPEWFARVLSHVGSYTNIKGGHNYPWLIRSSPRKDIRVFLQSGSNDAATLFGDWPLANQTMANALGYAGYDYRFEFGSGGHSIAHGGALLADSIRWLLRADV